MQCPNEEITREAVEAMVKATTVATKAMTTSREKAIVKRHLKGFNNSIDSSSEE